MPMLRIAASAGDTKTVELLLDAGLGTEDLIRT